MGNDKFSTTSVNCIYSIFKLIELRNIEYAYRIIVIFLLSVNLIHIKVASMFSKGPFLTYSYTTNFLYTVYKLVNN